MSDGTGAGKEMTNVGGEGRRAEKCLRQIKRSIVAEPQGHTSLIIRPQSGTSSKTCCWDSVLFSASLDNYSDHCVEGTEPLPHVFLVTFWVSAAPEGTKHAAILTVMGAHALQLWVALMWKM